MPIVTSNNFFFVLKEAKVDNKNKLIFFHSTSYFNNRNSEIIVYDLNINENK